eukprot:6131727-Pleurochrysis_carterae.AAC.2
MDILCVVPRDVIRYDITYAESQNTQTQNKTKISHCCSLKLNWPLSRTLRNNLFWHGPTNYEVQENWEGDSKSSNMLLLHITNVVIASACQFSKKSLVWEACITQEVARPHCAF